MAEGALARALEREHREIDGGIEGYLGGLGDGGTDPDPLLRAMAGLRRHIYLEEEFLSPPLNEAGMTMPVFVMLREHGELWDAMDGLDALLTGATTSEVLQNACTTSSPRDGWPTADAARKRCNPSSDGASAGTFVRTSIIRDRTR